MTRWRTLFSPFLTVLLATCALHPLPAQAMDTTRVPVPYLDSVPVVASVDSAVERVDTTWHVVTTYRDSVFSACCRDSLVITPVPAPPPPLAGTNEPAGWRAIAELPGDVSPTTGFGSVTGATGGWMVTPAPLKAVAGALRVIYPAGLVAGRAPVSIAGWSGTSTSNPATVRGLYLRMDFTLGNASGFENQVVGTKFGFISYGSPYYLARNQGFFLLKGAGVQQVMTSMSLLFVQQNLVARTFSPNKKAALVFPGRPHRIEAVFGLNSAPGVADGTLQVWLDGALTHDYRNVVYTTGSNTRPFQGYDFNPTWGGVGGTRTRPDTVWVDHLRLSGAP